METDEKLIRRLNDLSRQAESRNMYTFSDFLSLPEQELFYAGRAGSAGVRASLYGPSETAERKIAVFGSEDDFGYAPEYPVRLLEVRPAAPRFAEALSHRDYLGAILGLGIERELVGDIIIKEKNAWFFCMDRIADYLEQSLTQVKHTNVVCRIITEDIPELAPVFEPLSLNVAAERLDCVVAAFVNQSRSHAQSMIRGQLVTVNGRIQQDPSKQMKEGDTFSVRGVGKAIYDGALHETKKGRLYVSLRKYV